MSTNHHFFVSVKKKTQPFYINFIYKKILANREFFSGQSSALIRQTFWHMGNVLLRLGYAITVLYVVTLFQVRSMDSHSELNVG